jgi:hypothetical protein
MYLSESHLRGDITCQRCKKMFVDPRILPCGECICFKCTIGHIKGFKCFNCNEMHFTPRNGFPVCNIMVSLLKKKFVDIKFNTLEEFKQKLNELKNNLDSLSSNVETSDEIVSEHCEMVKHQINVKTESLIQQLEKKRNALLNKVDDYEIQCKHNIKKKKTHFEMIIKENNQLFDEYTDYLNKQNIDENVVIEMNKTSITKIKDLNIAILNFNDVIFNNNKMIFNERQNNYINSFIIGQLISGSPNSFDLTKYFEVFDLKSKIKSLLHIYHLLILDNENIAIFYKDASLCSIICVFDGEYNLKKTVKI